MFIRTETTADPAVMRFLPGRSVMDTGTAQFTDADSARRSPLAERLFAAGAIASVTLGPDYVDVASAAEADWTDLKPAVLRAVMEHFVAGDPVLSASEEPSATTGEPADQTGADTEIVDQIRELIETRIHPAVTQNGGDVTFRGYEDGIVIVDLIGPAIGMKQPIQNMLSHYVPEVVGLRSYDEHQRLVSPGMNTPQALAVRQVLDDDINPGVAGHGGHIALIDVKENVTYIQLEGGCQGCGMADVTLKQGIETAIRRAVPSITAVLDVTDHAGGTNPYYQPGKGGVSPI